MHSTNPSRPRRFAAAAMFSMLVVFSAVAHAAADRPNILIIMSDQQRAGFTKRSGFAADTQPMIDRLAEAGVAFDGAYATSPLCSPCRVSLLTGRFPHAHRVRQNSGNRHAFFSEDIFDVAGKLGYARAVVGKNHTYLRPDKTDFWRPYGHLGGYQKPDAPAHVREFDAYLKRLNHGVAMEPTPYPLEAQLPYRIVDDAIEFLDGYADRPFLMWVSFPEPHNPYQIPKPYWNMWPPDSVPERGAGPEALEAKGFKWVWLSRLENHFYPDYDRHWRRLRSNYLGMLRMIDDQVARLVQYMDARNLRNDTVIVYTTDHGDYVGDYGLMRKGVEMPEALIRIPLLFSGWGIKGGRPHHPALVSTADVMPTLCEAIGAEMPLGVQGRSLWPLLQGRDYPQREFASVYAEVGYGGLHYDADDELDFMHASIPGRLDGAPTTFDELNSYTQSGNLKMVRMGDWKLLFDMMGRGQLYNLKADPYELNNRYDDPAAAQMKLRLLEELLAWTIRTQDDLPTAAYRNKWAQRNWYAPHREK